nr:reverse transcriptase domain-containing protein [Tanacetum cinerariifolium]
MLGEHNITYRPRTSVKGQILADFLTEMPDEISPAAPVAENQQEPGTLFTDGSSCVDGSCAGLILTNPKGIEFTYALRFHFAVEYEALIAGLRIAAQIGVQNVHVGSSCVDGSGAGLIQTSLEGTEFTYALRFQFTASNNEAEYEALIVGLRIAAQMRVRNVHVSVDSKLVANQVLGTYVAKEENMIKYFEKTKSLISGFAKFSISQVSRSKNKKADALSKIASTSFAHLSKQVLVEVLKENSIQEREMATVVEEEEATWMTPIIEYLRDETLLDNRKEASKLRIKSRQYELLEGILYRRSFLKPRLRHPQQPLTPITPWPFYKWGIDIACTFPEGPGKVKFLIVAMDYFTKWIEAKAVATISGSQVKKFVWDNIVCRFGLSEEIVTDNSNGLVERENRSLGEGIKARLGEGNKNWLEELPHILWAHRTMIKSSNNDTPFSLTYETVVTNIQKKDKNKAKTDKTEHGLEKAQKVIKSKSKTKPEPNPKKS